MVEGEAWPKAKTNPSIQYDVVILFWPNTSYAVCHLISLNPISTKVVYIFFSCRTGLFSPWCFYCNLLPHFGLYCMFLTATLPETNMTSPLKIRRGPKKEISSSNHQSSGGEHVSSREVHPGRLTAGTYKSPMKRKEHYPPKLHDS